MPHQKSVVTEWHKNLLPYTANMAQLQPLGQAVGCQASLWLVAGSGKLQHAVILKSEEARR